MTGPRRVAVLCCALLAGVLVACAPGGDSGDSPAALRTTRPAGPPRTLVLYDHTGPYGALGELYATEVANLVSRFGRWTAHPAARYTAGEYKDYTALVYVGSTYDEPLPAALLDDMADAAVPVLWVNDNLWQLTRRHPDAAARYGFAPQEFDGAAVTAIRYRTTVLMRDTRNTARIMRVKVTDAARAVPVAEAVRADGSTFPWAVRAGNLTYVGELPFTYITPDDRYLAFADLLYDLLAPDTAVRHRALVRIEDVGPQSDPVKLRAIAAYLYSRKVPFSLAVFAEYDDPAGRYSGGRPVRRTLRQAPRLVAALRYAAAHGGTLVMHGYTHAYAGGPNPYGVSAEDFEFYRAHLDATDKVILDGPLPEDSPAWALARLAAARREWRAAGLPVPRIFEFPHYAASAADYRAISGQVDARYEQALYFAGVLSGGKVDAGRSVSQYFPYPVRDVYGARVIPETLGNVEVRAYNQHPARLPADIVASARRQLAVRDGVAGFFYHPFLGLTYLPALVDGIRALGYTFVSPSDVLRS